MHAVSSDNIVIGPGCLDEAGIMLGSQKRVWEVTEELLQQTSDAVDIVEEVLRVTEVKIT
jgi:hypothetical protein